VNIFEEIPICTLLAVSSVYTRNATRLSLIAMHADTFLGIVLMLADYTLLW